MPARDDELTEKPLPLALLVADEVYHDRQSGKWIVAGIYSTITFASLPATRESVSIFFQVTNVSRPVELRLNIEHSDGDTVLLDVGGPFKAHSPLEVVAQKVVLRNVPFRMQGKYWVQLKSGEEILMQVPLYVAVAPQSDAEEGDEAGDGPDDSFA